LLDSTPHYENFPVGSWLVPHALRPAYAAIYRFARHADDIADEGDLSDRERLCQLQHLGQSLRGEANHPIATQVIAHIEAQKLNLECLFRLLAAFSQDIEKKRYQNFQDLLNYCEGSANPVGELVLGLFASHSGLDLSSTDHLEKSNQICSALQIINFLQDMEVDWQKNRIYLPLELAKQCGLSEHRLETLFEESHRLGAIPHGADGQALKQAIRLLHQQTQSLLSAGRPLTRMVPFRLSLELRAICAGGQRILDLITEGQFDPFAKRPKLGARDLPSLLRLFFLASPVSSTSQVSPRKQ
jgi:squalene synthase HpnC